MMEQARPGLGLLQNEEKFIRIMLVEWKNIYIICSLTELVPSSCKSRQQLY